MQKLSSLHKFILFKVWWTKLNGHVYFHYAHPKIIELTFSFPEIAPVCKKSVHFIYSFLRCSQFLQTYHTHFLPCSKKCLINFEFMWICINMQNIELFHWFVLEIWLIKKSCNLIRWENFSPYFMNINFHKNGISAGTQQIIQIFIVEKIQWKLMTRFFNKFRKLSLVHFCSIFPTLGPLFYFSGNLALPCISSYGFLTPCQH